LPNKYILCSEGIAVWFLVVYTYVYTTRFQHSKRKFLPSHEGIFIYK